MTRGVRAAVSAAVVALAAVLVPAHAAPQVREVPGRALPSRAVTLEDFSWRIPLDTDGQDAIYRVELPPAVYQGVQRADLGDVRVFNQRGERVPHVLRRPATEAGVAAPTLLPVPFFPLQGDASAATEALRLTVRTKDGSIDLSRSSAADPGQSPPAGYLVDGREAYDAARDIEALAFAWTDDSPPFSGRFKLEASDDLTAWRTVTADAPLLSLRHGNQRLAQNRIDFLPMRARYWRLSAAPARENQAMPQALPPIAGVSAQTVPVRGERQRAQRDLTSGGGQPGEYLFDTGGYFPVDRVALLLPEINTVADARIFSRASATAPWREVTRATVYRLQQNGQEIASAALPVAGNVDRYWRVYIDPASGAVGAAAPRLRIAWFPRQLFFVARGDGPFELAYGSADVPPAPSALDGLLAADGSARDDLALGTIKTARLGEARQVADARPTAPPLQAPPQTLPAPWRTHALWAVLLACVALLGWMAWRLSRQMQAGAAADAASDAGAPPPR